MAVVAGLKDHGMLVALALALVLALVLVLMRARALVVVLAGSPNWPNPNTSPEPGGVRGWVGDRARGYVDRVD